MRHLLYLLVGTSILGAGCGVIVLFFWLIVAAPGYLGAGILAVATVIAAYRLGEESVGGL